MLTGWQIGAVYFDTTRRMLLTASEQVYLEPRLYALLLALIEAPQQQCSREQLILLVWQGRVVSESAINRAVSLLRKAFASLDPSQPYLETLAKVGYRLQVAAVAVSGLAETVSAVQVEPPPTTGQSWAGGWRWSGSWRWPLWFAMLLLLAVTAGIVLWNQDAVSPLQAKPQPQTSDDGLEYQLSITHDGQWLSYLQQQGSRLHWYLQHATGGQSRGGQQQRQLLEVTGGGLRFSSISPDGQWLLYEVCQPHCSVRLKAGPVKPPQTVALADRELFSTPTDSQLKLSWQEDSQAFYFRKRADKTKPYSIFRFDLATKALQQLTLANAGSGDLAVALSPDQRWLAVASYRQQQQTELRILDRQSLTQVAALTVPYAVSALSFQDSSQLWFGCDLQLCRWTLADHAAEALFHTGAKIQSLQALSGQLWYATRQQRSEIWRYSRLDQQHQQVVAGARLDWMPRVTGNADGKSGKAEELVFLSDRSGQQQLWRKQGNAPEQLFSELPTVAEFTRTSHNLDGTELLLSQQGAIYALNLASGQHQMLLGPSTKAAVVNAGETATQLIYSSEQSGDWQLYLLDRSNGQSRQLTQQGGYSGYWWQGQLWFSKYHQNGLFRLNPDGTEQLMLADFDKINWLNWHVLDDSLVFYRPGQGIFQWRPAQPEQAPQLLMPHTADFLHHYQVTSNAIWYVRQPQAQGDIFSLQLPSGHASE